MAEQTAYLGEFTIMKILFKLKIADTVLYHVIQEFGPSGENDQRLIFYKIFICLLHDLGMLKTGERLRKAYAYACNYNRDYKRVAQNMHISLGFNDK